jgi:hypothetical protein
MLLCAAVCCCAQVLRTNLYSCFNILRPAVKAMMKSGGGSIAFCSSAVAQHGIPNHEAIAAAKAGVVGEWPGQGAGISANGGGRCEQKSLSHTSGPPYTLQSAFLSLLSLGGVLAGVCIGSWCFQHKLLRIRALTLLLPPPLLCCRSGAVCCVHVCAQEHPCQLRGARPHPHPPS